MEYNLTIGEITGPVEITEKEENSAAVEIGERQYDVTYSRISDNELHLMVNGLNVNAYVASDKTGKTIMLNGKTYRVEDADQVSSGPKKKKGMDTPTTVTPPMPAVVIAVKAAEGDQVEKGQGVVVVSAMKMETTLVAPYNGVVTKVNVAENDKVMPGEILVDIEEIKDEELTDLEN